MRTTLDIDDDVLQAAKELGEFYGKTAGQMRSDLARKGLAPRGPEQRLPQRRPAAAAPASRHADLDDETGERAQR